MSGVTDTVHYCHVKVNVWYWINDQGTSFSWSKSGIHVMFAECKTCAWRLLWQNRLKLKQQTWYAKPMSKEKIATSFSISACLAAFPSSWYWVLLAYKCVCVCVCVRERERERHCGHFHVLFFRHLDARNPSAWFPSSQHAKMHSYNYAQYISDLPAPAEDFQNEEHSPSSFGKHHPGSCTWNCW